MPRLITPQNLWSEMLKFKNLIGLKHGFTIPFIIGAYNKLGFIKDVDLMSPVCIRYLINNILESTTTEHPIRIFDCPHVNNELILQYLSTGLNAEDAKYIMSWETNIDNKIYWHNKEIEVTDVDSLIQWIWNKPTTRGNIPYSVLISSKRFSCDMGSWDNFNEKEENFLNNLNTH